MADNFTLPDGKTVRARDVNGVLYPVSVVAFANEEIPSEISYARPIPVTRLAGRELRRLPIAIAALGNNQVVAPIASHSIRVVSLLLIVSTDVNLTFFSGSVPISGPLPLSKGVGFVLPECEGGWLETSIGQPLIAQLSGAVSIGGMINYQEVEP